MADENRRIYTDTYAPAALERRSETPYDAAMIDLRDELVREHASGRDLLDLCCGTGAYAIPAAGLARRTYAVDFSHTMLRALAAQPGAAALCVAEADAQALPFAGGSVDAVVSFASLYYVPDVETVLLEVARVLRPGGRAVLELGNLWSLNTIVVRTQHRHAGWAEPHHVSYRAMRAAIRAAGLEVDAWRAFQVLPMFGAPRRLAWLAPLLSGRWKRVLGVRVGGRLLDEMLSTTRPFRYVAFRHLVVVRRP